METCKKMIQIAEEQKIQIDAYREAAEMWSKKARELEKRMKTIENAIEKYPDFKDYVAGYNCGGYHD